MRSEQRERAAHCVELVCWSEGDDGVSQCEMVAGPICQLF